METASVLAVCRVHQLLPDEGSVGVTAIDKRPVEGPVKVHKLGLHGDVQASRIHHGGEDQAIYAYSQADADYWVEASFSATSRPGSSARTCGLPASKPPGR